MRVLVVGDPRGRDSGEAIARQLSDMGFDASVVLTPGEALWHLGAEHHGFDAVVIDGDRGLPDRFELMGFVRDTHPELARVLILTEPSVSELENWVVVDRLTWSNLRSALERRPDR